MSARDSIGDAFRAARALPALAHWIGAVAALLSGGVGAVLGAKAYADGYATDVEVASTVAPLATREYVDRSFGKLAQDLEQDRKAQRKRDRVAFEMQVSGAAADKEEDRRRKADAAAFARNVYRDAMARGLEPEDAAALALDARPPWRK